MRNAPLLPGLDHFALASALWPAVVAAARVQLAYFTTGTAVVTKADMTPVTAADQESETLILAALATIAPGVPVVAEEAMASGAEPRIGTDGDAAFFLVDPLDGTREFINGRPEFTINIALVRGGVPRFGLIYVPAVGQLYVTLGPHRVIEAQMDPAQPAPQLASLPMADIHARRPRPEGLVAVASRSNNSPGTDAFLGQYVIATRTSAGSSMKFCLLAKGVADIYPRVGPTCEWDTAAGHAILAVAGGSVTELDGTPLTYGKSAARYRNPDFVAWGHRPMPPQH